MALSDPFSDLRDGLKGDTQLRGVNIVVSARKLPEAGSASRVVLVPVRFNDRPPESKLDLTDIEEVIEAHLWARIGPVGKEMSPIWNLVANFTLAVWNYRIDSDVNVQHDGGTFSPESDTAQDGYAALVTLRLRGQATIVPPGGIGLINAVQIDGIFVPLVYTMASQTFLYTVPSSDLSDFFVDLPTTEVDASYAPTYTLDDLSNDVILSFPTTTAGDRTAARFHVLSSGPLAAGETIEFTINRRTS
jgi:hypothetical protein